MKRLSGAGMLPALLPGCLVFVALAQYYARGGMIDDSFISFRYAENLAAGHGLVFNAGERPVEGYSNFLWVVILGGCHLAGAETVAAARLLGMLCGLGVLAMVCLLMRLGNSSPGYTALAVTATATAPAVGVYAISGMETLLYSFLLALFLYLFLREELSGFRLPVSGLAGALVCLTRPEGFIIIAIFALYRAVQFFTEPARRRFIVLWGLELAAVFAPFVLWRYWYYGHWLPMPVYAKVTGEYLYRGLRQLLGGGRYFYGFARTYGGGVLVVLLLAFAARHLVDWWRSGGRTTQPAVTIPALFFLWYIVYAINVGGDWMPQFRFFVPLLPIMYVLVAGPDFLALFPAGFRGLVPLALVGFNCVQIPLVAGAAVQEVEPYMQYQGISANPALARHYRDLGAVFKDQTLATTESGMLPYYSGLRTIDMMGLSDEFIGMAFYRSRGLYQTKDLVYDTALDYVFGLKPEVVHVGGGLRNNSAYFSRLMGADAFRTHYELRREYSMGSDEFYVRKPAP